MAGPVRTKTSRPEGAADTPLGWCAASPGRGFTTALKLSRVSRRGFGSNICKAKRCPLQRTSGREFPAPQPSIPLPVHTTPQRSSCTPEERYNSLKNFTVSSSINGLLAFFLHLSLWPELGKNFLQSKEKDAGRQEVQQSLLIYLNV